MPDTSKSSAPSDAADMNPEDVAENKTVAQHIEDLTMLFPKAINERTFDLEKLPWSLLADSFRAEMPYFRQQEKMTPAEYVAHWKDFTTKNPDFRCEVVHTDVFVNRKADIAECYMTWKSNNSHHVLFLSSTSKVTWRLDLGGSGEWYSTNHVSLPGLPAFE